jgi:hypothetical protein
MGKEEENFCMNLTSQFLLLAEGEQEWEKDGDGETEE